MKRRTFVDKYFNNHLSKIFLFFLLMLSDSIIVQGQCPSNIDFENGTFDGWTCWSGLVNSVNNQNVISLEQLPGPLPNHQTMYSSSPGNGLDEYGGFPKNCPNGSGHSIRLGDNQSGGQADGISYDFTIPQNANNFTLTYNYAVVFEDPGHAPDKQPRLEIEVKDLTDNVAIDCFSFAYIAYSSLPGFFTSAIQPHDSPVRYKDWTANTIYLNGYQGKTIRLFITTADCTYSIHFGYAYIDVSSKCDNSLVGETYCAQDTALDINAPSGYQGYNWYNSTFSQLLGTEQVLHLEPPPPAGTALSVELIPFPGYGCKDTLNVQLEDTLTAKASAGPDISSCNLNPVQLGIPPVSGMVYKWTPAYGLSDPDIANPFALPDKDTTYILTVQSSGGGCFSRDTVRVYVANIDDSLELIGDNQHCLGNGPDPILKVLPASSVQWYKNDQPIIGANQLTYTVRSSGIYSASLMSNRCSNPIRTRAIDMIIDTSAEGISYPVVDIAFNFPIQLQARRLDLANSVLWMPDTNLDDARSFSPYFKSLNPQSYTVEIRTENGCTTIDTQVVKTHKEIAIYVPTVFTPDGDGNNDYLRPLLLGFEKLTYFRIYNRWGKLIFETKSDRPGWDGRIGDLPQETQTVVWMLEAIDVDGKKHFRKGTTLLLH